ncbi:MAG: 3-keto-5-aminohexanoate cleavage protein [Bacteroidetes bacterium]|nr:3-keto-5-aminohexanoate cleavage protein [Bacteroidota bacterium]
MECDDLIINFTPTGMIPTKKLTSFVPISVSEIIEDSHRAIELGITMIHLHARDEKTGVPTPDAAIYGKIIEGIRTISKDLIICVSLSGRNFKEFKQRAEPLQLDGDLKPDMGSLTLSSLNFNNMESVNSPKMIQSLAQEMKDKGIMPELEAFDAGMINYAKYLNKKGILEPPYYFNLLLGNIACAQADILHTGIMINDLPEESYWSLAGIGQSQLKMNALAIATGGGVRVGLEDNIWFNNGRTKLAKNQDLIARIHNLAAANERKVMTPAKLRSLLKLKSGNGNYGRQSTLNKLEQNK